MKQFIYKISLFSTGALIVLAATFKGINYYFNDYSNENSLFIWGDSQTYQGVDLDKLKQQTNKSVYSAAFHGAGVYDFLVFVDQVPENSEVIIAISKPSFIRKKNRDYNQSGLSLKGLTILAKHGYDFFEIQDVINKNYKPKKLYRTQSNLYEYSDTLTLEEPIEVVEEAYRNIPSYLEDKINIFNDGLKILEKKKCKVIYLVFPYHKSLTKIESNSPIKSITDSYLESIRINKSISIDTLFLKQGKENMHDLTHLNEYGAGQVSEYLSSCIRKQGNQLIYISNNKY